jgi:hypothetical protein
MVSETLRRANRRNAARSTGPKSASGKARASGNALRHGLGAIRFDEPEISEEVRRIVEALCPGEVDPLWLDQAVTIAESQVMLRRVRAARGAAIARVREQIAGCADCRPAIDALRRLERYERRALSRRRGAIDALARLAAA